MRLEPIIAKRAKENLSAGGGNRKSPLTKSAKAVAKPVDTRKELAKIAGVAPDTIAKRAKEAQKAGGGSGKSGRQKSDKPTDTKKELAKIAGVSHDTIAKAKLVGIDGGDEMPIMIVSQVQTDTIRFSPMLWILNSTPQTPSGPSRLVTPAAWSNRRVDRTGRALPFFGSGPHE